MERQVLSGRADAEPDVCGICLGPLLNIMERDEDQQSLLSCKLHEDDRLWRCVRCSKEAHMTCMRQWRRRKPTCPYCRYNAKAKARQEGSKACLCLCGYILFSSWYSAFAHDTLALLWSLGIAAFCACDTIDYDADIPPLRV